MIVSLDTYRNENTSSKFLCHARVFNKDEKSPLLIHLNPLKTLKIINVNEMENKNKYHEQDELFIKRTEK